MGQPDPMDPSGAPARERPIERPGAHPERAPISACVMAADDPESLERCLEALRFASEINVLLDARHGDACAAVAEAHAHVVSAHAYEGDLDQRRRSLAMASHEWALAIDPDEIVSEALAREISRAVATAPADLHGFELDRVTWHLGRWIEHGDFHPDWKLRLVRRAHARVAGRDPHGRIEVAGRVQRLRGRLEHYSYRDLADQVRRMIFFSGEAARAMYAEGQRAGFSRLVLRPPARFLRGYLLKQGFRDGWPGFVVAVVTSFYVFLKYARLWELERAARR
jgi:hypothetical protein